MTIEYSCICRGHTILCSHQIGSGSFENVVQSMLPNIQTRSDTKTTYTGENNYQFHCVIDNGMIYMCVANNEFGKLQPYAYLTEIKRQFQASSLGSRAITATYGELNRDFQHVMMKQMEKFSSGGRGDQVSTLRAQVDDVKGIMTQNIEKVLERGENLEDLQNKTEELEHSSHVFQRTARKVHRKFWMKNLKMKIIIAVIIFVILFALIMIILGTSTDVFKSKSSGSSTTTPKP